MDIIGNKKYVVFVLSAVLLVFIALLFFPNLFSYKKRFIPTESAEITQIKSQSSDTSLESIKVDINNTDIEGVDAELNAIEKELGGSM